MIIFIAGPYAKPDPVINTRNAILAAEEVLKRGHIPYIPHLCHLWHLVSPHEEGFWSEYDLKFLPLCHAILRLPGESKGADKEVRIAEEELFLTVFRDIDEIPMEEK